MIVKRLIGKELKKSRKENNIDVDCIAKELKIQRKTVFNIEGGIGLSINNSRKFYQICRAYRTSPVQLTKEVIEKFIQTSNMYTNEEVQRYSTEIDGLCAISEQMQHEKELLLREAYEDLENATTKVFTALDIYSDKEKENLIEIIKQIIQTRSLQIKKSGGDK